jgi:hypothetical protein
VESKARTEASTPVAQLDRLVLNVVGFLLRPARDLLGRGPWHVSFVFGSHPDHNLWGVTVDNRYFVWRSGVGITADGTIV